MATGRFNLDHLGSNLPNDFLTLAARAEGAKGALLFSASQTESGLWGLTVEDFASALSLLLPTYMKSAVVGKVDFEVEVMAIEDGDSVDVEVASFDAVNEISGGTTVAGTAKYPTWVTILCANDDSPSGSAVGFLFRINRDHDDADDTATGDAAIGPNPIAGSYTTT